MSIKVNPDKEVKHRHVTETVETSTLSKRKLICQARNEEGIQTDGYIFIVLSKVLS